MFSGTMCCFQGPQNFKILIGIVNARHRYPAKYPKGIFK